ncbi:cytochrome P450 alkane hydroxylase [Truncatella angustata]|uniref:Cytochrome P450 alkane hydroxylase n=1 Tax=Truncatella angustata TaxID=152316 RepID=A0A9P8UFL9_9PEZI|nr:cytochrome P450 alkane hydroxylase [Truncatella angustata]KAH6648933.1 cytochrome P450 alkane hydroxylase [Truncatella angustata]
MITVLAPDLTPSHAGLIAVIAIVVVHLFLRLRYAAKVRRAGGMHAPSLARDPFTALSWMLRIGRAQVQNRIHEAFRDMFQNYTTSQIPNAVEINLSGTRRYIFTQEPSHIKTILTGKFGAFGKGEDFHRVWKPFLGDSIFTTDEQQWQESRSLIRPMFVKTRLNDVAIFEKCTEVMLSQFPPPGTTFDIQDLFYRMTIDTITAFLLGESVGSLENPRNEFAAAFSEVQRDQMTFQLLMPVEKFIPRGRYKRGIKVMENFIAPFVEKALLLRDDELENMSKSDNNFTFLHALISHTRNPTVIRDQIMSVLLAGRDTTAATMSWCLYELARNPKVYTKIREEVIASCGTSRAPNYEELKNMRYLNHTLNETLRLYPAVPINVRSAKTDSSLAGPNPSHPDITVVAGDTIFYSTFLMQRRPDLYPPPSSTFAPVDQFSPDRWEHWQPKPWQFVPFNGGPRICIGQQFALVEMGFVLSRMMQRYERIESRDCSGGQFQKVEVVGCPGRSVKIAAF